MIRRLEKIRNFVRNLTFLGTAVAAFGFVLTDAKPATAARQGTFQITGCATWITSGETVLYALDCSPGLDKGVWSFNNNNDTWTQLPGTARRISAHKTGGLWALNGSSQLQRWNGSSWNAPLSGCLTDVAAGPSPLGIGPTVYALGCDAGPDKTIWRHTDGNGWEQMAGAAAQISVTTAGDVWVLTSGHAFFKWNGTSFVGQQGVSSEIGHGGQNMLALGTDNKPYQFNGTWSLINTQSVFSTTLIQLAGNSSFNNNGPWFLDASGKMYYNFNM